LKRQGLRKQSFFVVEKWIRTHHQPSGWSPALEKGGES
jgi:hypothetical protein